MSNSSSCLSPSSSPVYAYDRGCRCDRCVAGHREYHRVWARERRAGRKRLVFADEAREHLAVLMASGHSAAGLQTLTGMSDSAILQILCGKRSKIRPAHEDRILGVAISDVPDGKHCIPSRHARRLYEAMLAQGVAPGDVVRMLGYAKGSSTPPFLKSPTITIRNHRRMCVLYELLARAGRVEPILPQKVTA